MFLTSAALTLITKFINYSSIILLYFVFYIIIIINVFSLSSTAETGTYLLIILISNQYIFSAKAIRRYIYSSFTLTICELNTNFELENQYSSSTMRLKSGRRKEDSHQNVASQNLALTAFPNLATSTPLQQSLSPIPPSAVDAPHAHRKRRAGSDLETEQTTHRSRKRARLEKPTGSHLQVCQSPLNYI